MSRGETVPMERAESVTRTALPHPRSPRRPAAGLESLLVGRTIGDRYEVAAVLGRGGMGVVYRARDERLGRDVAVKVIHVPNAAPEAQETLRSRFRREARSAARLRHPNVVTVFDYVTDDDLGLDYLVMELLQGEDMAARVQREGTLPVSLGLRILGEAAQGIAAGHRAGLIHRDVMPANLFLENGDDRSGPRVRVLDFGIAQVLEMGERR